MKIKAGLLALTLLTVNCFAIAREAKAPGAKNQPVALFGVNVVPTTPHARRPGSSLCRQ